MSASGRRPVCAGKEEIEQIAVFIPEANGEPWSYLGVENSDLAIAASELAKGKLRDWDSDKVSRVPCGMTTLEGLFTVGPTHHLIGHLPGREPIGAFEFHPLKERVIAKDASLWAANCETQKRLIVQPTHKGIVVRKELAQRMRRRKSKLLYARGMSWLSQSLLTATTDDLVLGGSAWTTLQRDSEEVQKAFALWANSAFGMLVHWTRGQRTQKGRSRTQIGALKQIPCPNLARLPKEKLERAALAFDELSKRELKPACQAHCDENRKRIDWAVCQMLFPMNLMQTISKLRQLWCAEPSVHGNNKTALKLLKEKDCRSNGTKVF